VAVHDALSTTHLTTDDRLLGGTLHFTQPAEGYRAPVDGLLLADFARASQRVAVDLGAGAGMVTLALLARNRVPNVIAVEQDEVLAHCLARNIDANRFGPRAIALRDDVRAVAKSRRGCADLVVANPPYYTRDTHTPATHERARDARAGIVVSVDPLADFVIATRALLGRGGRACFVWPAQDLERLVSRAQQSGLAARRMRFFHPRSDGVARRVLVEFRPGRAGGLEIEAPLFQFDDAGNETTAFRRITSASEG
jgi:tRNA1(Val) A37 N6-methylase TrmN6